MDDMDQALESGRITPSEYLEAMVERGTDMKEAALAAIKDGRTRVVGAVISVATVMWMLMPAGV